MPPSQDFTTPSFSDVFNSLLPPAQQPLATMPGPTQAELDELFGLSNLDYGTSFDAMDLDGGSGDWWNYQSMGDVNAALTQTAGEVNPAVAQSLANVQTVPDLSMGDVNSVLNQNVGTASTAAPSGSLDPLVPHSSTHAFAFEQSKQPARPLLPTPSDSTPSSTDLTSRMDLSNYFNTDLAAFGGSNSISGSSSDALYSSPVPRPASLSCSCQGRALDLMGQPTPAQSRQQSAASSPHGGRPSFESVLDRNHSTTDAMAEILQCPCGKDAYTLIVLVLATFKTLEWFDAAAASSPAEEAARFVSLPDAGVHGDRGSGDDPSRAAAQIVLSRLPSVNRIVSTISEQLRILHRSTSGVIGSGGDAQRQLTSGETANLRAANHPFTAPLLSSSLANTLESDLRRRTLALAKSVIIRLR